MEINTRLNIKTDQYIFYIFKFNEWKIQYDTSDLVVTWGKMIFKKT